MQESRSSDAASSGRRRTNGRACVACHERKVRCDILNRGSPCSNCRTHRKDGCQLYEKKKSRTRAVRSARSSNAHVRPRQPASASGLSSSLTLRRHRETPEDESSIHVSPFGNSPSPKAQRSRRLPVGRDAASPPPDSSEIDGSTSNLAEFIDSDDFRAREISQTGRLYFIGTEFSNLNYLVRQRSRATNPEILHFGTPPMGRGLPSVPSEALQLPPKGVCDQLIEAYFVHINRGFPIVDEDEFMKIYRDPQQSVRPFSLLLVNAVLLVGSHVLSTQHEELRPLQGILFRRTKLLFDSRYDKHREKYIQAALLLTWYCNSLEDVISNSWYWVGFAARTAVGMGMHRDATASSLNASDKRQWMRWWWVLLQFDVTISTSYGRPQALDLEECDVPELQEYHMQGIPHADAAFAIHHTRLCVIFSKAMRKIVSIKTAPADRCEAIRRADEDLANFITELPDSLKLPLAQPGTWQAILHLSYNNFLILLHRPSPRAEHARLEVTSAGDQSICSDAVMVITSIFESLRARGRLGHLWLPSLYVLFTAMVYVAKDLCSVNPVVVAKSRRMFDSLLMTLRELSQHWLYAQSLLRLFEHRKLWRKDEEYDVPQQDASLPEAGPADLQSTLIDSGTSKQAAQNPSDSNTGDFSDSQYNVTTQSEEFLPLDAWLYPTSQPERNELATAGNESWDISMAPSDLEMFLASIGNDYLF